MFKNIVYSLITRGSVAVINLFILLISSRYLGVTTRGEISIFLLNIAIIQVLNEIYTGYSLVHFIPKFNFKKIVVTGLVLTVVFSIISNLLFIQFDKQVEGTSFPAFLITAAVLLNTFFCVLILGKEKIQRFSLLSFLQPALLLIGILVSVLIFKVYTIKAYLIPLFVSFAVSLLFSGGYVFREWIRSKSEGSFLLSEILLKGLTHQSGLLLFIFVNRYSYYLLGDRATVGVYSASCSLMESVLLISNGIAPVLLARTVHEKNENLSINAVMSLGKACFFISLLIVGTIILIPETVFLFLLGEGFKGIHHLMMLYAPGIVLMSLCGVISAYFIALGNQKRSLLCYAAGCLTTLLIAPVLIEKYSAQGAAVTATISYSLISVGMFMMFIVTCKVPLQKVFAVKEDLRFLKELVRFRNADVK